MQKKIVILILFLASLLQAQDENSNAKKQPNFDKLTLISVTIGGSFIVNGSFSSSTLERFDQFITRIFNDARNVALTIARDEQTLEKVTKKIDSYSRRNILLKRANGEEIKIDLERFRLTGDFKLNPYLRNDDVIIFPESNLETNFVIIEGAVNFPTKFPYSEGDKLSDALLFARGVNPVYENVQEVEIYRLDKTGTKEEIIRSGINDIVDLKIGDRIKVLSDQNNKKDFRILVLGEVKTPGYVFIKKGRTTIRQVIAKTGGFTENASLENSELLRGINSEQILRMKYIQEEFDMNPELRFSKFNVKYNYQNLETLLMSRAADLSVEDSLSFSFDNLLRLMHSPGIVDFTKIENDSYKDGDFVVKDGDVILIPEKENLVYLFGQIKSDGYVTYEEGKDYKYYIEKAGGIGEASNGDVKIIKAKSRTWVNAEDKTIIDPGDFIYLPKKISHTFGYYISQVGSVAGILSALGTLYYFIFVAK